jgi:hypothetical protein
MVVVDAMNDEVQAVADRVVGIPVEDLAVQPVLRQRPEPKPRDREGDQLERPLAVARAEHDQGDDHRDVDQRRHHRMDPREEVEEAALEQRRRGAQPGGAFTGHRPGF